MIFRNEQKKLDLDNLTNEELNNIDVLVTYNCFKNLDISRLNNLKYIQLSSTGFDQVPIEKMSNRDVILCNNKGGYSIPISEWIVLKILEIYKNTKKFYEKQFKKEWIVDKSILELYGKSVGFLGTGTLASESAKRLKAFGVEIWGCNTDGRNVKYFDRCVSNDNMDEIFSECDVVVSTIPSTKSTYKIINKDKFELMKNGSVFINVGRGKVVDEDDLIKYAHKFRGIALDVFENEPLSKDSGLWNLDNITITPHNSWISEQDSLRSFNLVYNNLKKFICGKELDNKVKITKGY